MGNLAASFAAAKLRSLNYVVLYDTGSLPVNLGKNQILHVLCDKDQIKDFCNLFELKTTDRRLGNNEYYTAPYTPGYIRVTPKGAGYFPETFETRLLKQRCWDFGDTVPVVAISLRPTIVLYEYAIHGVEFNQQRKEIIANHIKNTIGQCPYKTPAFIQHNDSATFNEPASEAILPIDIKAD